jgi:hydroxymethylbilane synthase
LILLGTRRSPLAQAQADRVLAAIPAHSARKVIIDSAGDVDRVTPLHKMDRPGAFTHALTDAILEGRIDAAVHSLKDLPLQAPLEAPLVAVLARDDPADVLLLRSDAVDRDRPLGLKAGSRIGSSAPRRQSQFQHTDPDLVPVDVRGNVETRLRLLQCGVVDGLLMAAAAIQRLGLKLPEGIESHRLDPTRFPGCPGQGTIAIQARRESDAARLLAPLDDPATRKAVEAERALLAELGGGCGLPLGAYAQPGNRHMLHATYGHGDRMARWVGPCSQAAGTAAQALRVRPEDGSRSGPAHARLVLLTLASERMGPYQRALKQAGWEAASWSPLHTIETGKPLPIDASQARWIAVTSPRAATFALQAATALSGPMRLAAVGPATARELRRLDLPVHVVAPEGTGASLAEAIARFPAEACAVLVPQAREAEGGLVEGLQQRGFAPIPWEVYSTHTTAGMPIPIAAQAIVITSPSCVRAVRAALPNPIGPRLVAFGPTTARAMQEAGLPVHATCSRRTPSGVMEALA